MVSRTPTEVWADILEEAVFVPHFFSTDPLAYHQTGAWAHRFQELPYWRSERRRNRLRRVHSSWNTILKRSEYQNRYVQLIDVVDGKVPESAVPQAIRLSIGFDPLKKLTKEIRKEGQNKLRSVLVRLLAERDGHAWRTQIIDDFNGPSLSVKSSLALLGRTPALQVLLGVENTAVLRKVAHGLRVVACVENVRTSSLAALPQYNFPHLTTLLIRLGWRSREALELAAAHFDQLRHLYIFQDHPPGGDATMLERIMPSMKKLGQNLLSFHFDEPTPWRRELPPGFWEQFPQLTSIQICCKWTVPPPMDHPLRSIRIRITKAFHASTDDCCRLAMSFKAVFPRLASPQPTGAPPNSSEQQWQGRIFTLVITTSWHDLLFRTCRYRPPRNTRLPPGWFSWEPCCPWLPVILLYIEAGWKVADCSGETLYEYLVFLIATHWKRGWNGHGDRGRSHCAMSIAWF